MQINNYLTIEMMIKLYCLYKKAEQERAQTDDKRMPIPYYIIGFLGELLGEKTPQNIQEKLEYIFGDEDVFSEMYRYLSVVNSDYTSDYGERMNPGDYNSMIKKPIDDAIFHYSVDRANNVANVAGWKSVKNWIEMH